MAVENRSYIEELVIKFFDIIDPSGVNGNKFRELFKGMNDVQCEKFWKRFLGSEERFVLDTVEFDHVAQLEFAKNALKFIDVPLMEYIYMPHLTKDKNNIIRSKEKCLVGYLNVKPTQQLVHKKNGLSTNNEKRAALTGQVTGEDKKARDSDVEATFLVSLGAEKILQEFHGPRADDMVMKRQMQQQIATRGYVNMEEMDNESVNKTTLNTIDMCLLSMGIMSDMVRKTYLLPKTSDELFN